MKFKGFETMPDDLSSIEKTEEQRKEKDNTEKESEKNQSAQKIDRRQTLSEKITSEKSVEEMSGDEKFSKLAEYELAMENKSGSMFTEEQIKKRARRIKFETMPHEEVADRAFDATIHDSQMTGKISEKTNMSFKTEGVIRRVREEKEKQENERLERSKKTAEVIELAKKKAEEDRQERSRRTAEVIAEATRKKAQGGEDRANTKKVA